MREAGEQLTVSIHAPRGGRDAAALDKADKDYLFQSTRPVGGATFAFEMLSQWVMFQSTRPVGGATSDVFGDTVVLTFQSTRPVGGATAPVRVQEYARRVSIHAPRGGRDTTTSTSCGMSILFQSTRPVGGAT